MGVIQIKTDVRPHSGRSPVLCVDLDRTLTVSDTVVDSIVLLVGLKAWSVLFWFVRQWLSNGRLAAKRALADYVVPEPATLPYNKDVIELIYKAKSDGRRTCLVTAADSRVAQSVADHLGLFDDVIASTERINLKGSAKVQALDALYGANNWSYVGDSKADTPVLNRSAVAYPVGSAPTSNVRVERLPAASPRSALWYWLDAIRIHQWVKNVLLLIPVIASHQVISPERWGTLLTAILSFCLVASSTYLFNDIMDMAADREHSKKKERPFASGALNPLYGLVAAAALLALGLGFASWVNATFLLCVGGYLALTLTYTFHLKRKPPVDILTLGALYAARVGAGSVAAGVPLSPWLMLFTLLLSIFLGVIKRLAELTSEGRSRLYTRSDTSFISMLGIGSGLMAAIVIGLYAQDPHSAALYSQPVWLFGFVPLILFWISHVAWIAHLGLMHHDPVVFALLDRTSHVCLVIGVALFTLAL